MKPRVQETPLNVYLQAVAATWTLLYSSLDSPVKLSGGSKSFLKSKIPLCHLSNPHPDEQRPNSRLNLERITQMHCRRQMFFYTSSRNEDLPGSQLLFYGD